MSDEKNEVRLHETTSRNVVLTNTGLNVEYKKTSKRPNRTRVSILTIHFEGTESGNKTVGAITSVSIWFDRRADTEHTLTIRWKAAGDWNAAGVNRRYTATENFEVRDPLSKRVVQSESRELNDGVFSSPFDQKAILAAFALDDVPATLKFLVAYLPAEFALEL